MDVSQKRKDFRRATICVPPSALSRSPNDSLGPLYTSPLKHRFSPWGQVFQDENDNRNNQTLNNLNFRKSHGSLIQSKSFGEDDYIKKQQPQSPDYSRDTFANNSSSTIDHRRLSTGSVYWESVRIHSLNNMGDKDDRKSSLFSINTADVKNNSENHSTYLRKDTNDSTFSNVDTNFSFPSSEASSDFNRDAGLSTPSTLGNNNNASGSSSIFSNLSTAIFGRHYFKERARARDDMSIGMKSKRQNSFIPKDNEKIGNDLTISSSSTLSSPQPNTREKENLSLSPPSKSSSPRPISPMGTLLLRTEF